MIRLQPCSDLDAEVTRLTSENMRLKFQVDAQRRDRENVREIERLKAENEKLRKELAAPSSKETP